MAETLLGWQLVPRQEVWGQSKNFIGLNFLYLDNFNIRWNFKSLISHCFNISFEADSLCLASNCFGWGEFASLNLSKQMCSIYPKFKYPFVTDYWKKQLKRKKKKKWYPWIQITLKSEVFILLNVLNTVTKLSLTWRKYSYWNFLSCSNYACGGLSISFLTNNSTPMCWLQLNLDIIDSSEE